MLKRRSLLLAGGSMPVAAPALLAQSPSQDGFDAVRSWGLMPPVMDTDNPSQAVVGTKPPYQTEIRRSFEIHTAAPRGIAPLAIARYFADLKDVNGENQKYNQEWPLDGRANPVIVTFFAATFTLPSGDQTSWCAAFVNYCLMLAYKPMTRSALSGSFRSAAELPETSNPQPGDIVVFQAPGARGAQGHGHVGFFLSRTLDTIEVLGGNQVGNTRSTGAVTTST